MVVVVPTGAGEVVIVAMVVVVTGREGVGVSVVDTTAVDVVAAGATVPLESHAAADRIRMRLTAKQTRRSIVNLDSTVAPWPRDAHWQKTVRDLGFLVACGVLMDG